MMRCICILSCLLLFAYGQIIEESPEVNNNISSNKSTSVSVSKTVTSVSNSNKENSEEFETAHKIHDSNEFETAHKINSDRPIVKLPEESADENLMQMQQTQNLLSTKERPELNPVLSALINEDVMKSIESKRAIENEEHLHEVPTTETPDEPKVTTLNNIILLTTQPPINKAIVDETGNDGLIDQSITLDEAGSENNQKSRIQIKKGPNGVDYEYEYVYYYYDDDEKTEKEKTSSTTNSRTKATPPTESKETTSRGKSRYTNIERSTTSAPENEIPSRGKGRASIPVTEDVDEGRLPAVTRFPPRNKNTDPTSTPSTEVEASEKSRKIGVKRPSLELVDSDSFNTDEKQVKGNRNLDMETSKSLGSSDNIKNIESDVSNKVSDAPTSDAKESNESDSSTDSDSDVENTTPLMEKVAFDLYAILANENLNMDITTDENEIATTSLPDSTGEDGLTTEGEDTVGASSTTTISTTTTTTTTTPEPTTTTTTTTTAATLIGGRRAGGLGSAGRNRFRLKSGSVSSTTTTESTPSESTTKGRNRFQRPSFGGRNNRPSSTAAPAKEETINKEESKPVSSGTASGGRGRTRNRFNLRGSTTTTERSADENAVDGQASSTTARTLRGRPTLNLRGRGRPTSTTPANPENDVDIEEKEKEEKPASALPTRPSRFNIQRPGAGGANRLLPRGRVNLAKTTATPAETETNDDDKKEAETKAESETGDENTNESGEEKPAEATTQAIGGLNRLRNRPRIQISAKTEKPKPQAVAINRKVNPLIARRKIALGSSTTEAAPAEEESDKSDHDENKEDSVEVKEEQKDETTEGVEVSSEQPRGLALLGTRRRLPLRKPGTLV